MSGKAFIVVRHNIEVAHRLYEMEGKCQQIHGHSMWVDLRLYGQLNGTGVLEGLEFGAVKKRFRGWLDSTFDHHLLLNIKDPFAEVLYRGVGTPDQNRRYDVIEAMQLPGLMAMPGDPTTENIAKWIAEWSVEQWKLPVDVLVHETAVNAASYSIDQP